MPHRRALEPRTVDCSTSPSPAATFNRLFAPLPCIQHPHAELFLRAVARQTPCTRAQLRVDAFAQGCRFPGSSDDGTYERVLRYPNGDERRIRYPLPPTPEEASSEDLTDGCWANTCWEFREQHWGGPPPRSGGGTATAERVRSAAVSPPAAPSPADFMPRQPPLAEVGAARASSWPESGIKPQHSMLCSIQTHCQLFPAWCELRAGLPNRLTAFSAFQTAPGCVSLLLESMHAVLPFTAAAREHAAALITHGTAALPNLP